MIELSPFDAEIAHRTFPDGVEIWDGHTHLAGLPGRTPEERLERLLECASRLNIVRVCVFMGTRWQYDPTPEEMQEANREVRQAVERFPERAFGFVYVNPNHVEASRDELRRHVRDGPMVGVKLWVARRCCDAALDPIVALAQEYQAVILQHTWIKSTGNLPGESTPQDLACLAQRHPDAVFIAAHSGGANWEVGLNALQGLSNVYAEVSGCDPTSGFTELAVRLLGAERVIFGSDAPGRSFATQLGKVLGASLDDKTKRLILSGNLKNVLQPILKTKGLPT
jgi:hypothetical protein